MPLSPFEGDELIHSQERLSKSKHSKQELKRVARATILIDRLVGSTGTIVMESRVRVESQQTICCLAKKTS